MLHGRLFNLVTGRNFYSPTPEVNEESEQDAKLVKDSLIAAEEVGPHVYKIHNLPDSKELRRLIYGCQGDEGPGQIAVAEMMRTTPHDDRVGCGDNFYPSGIFHPLDKRFIEQFYKLYGFVPNFMTIGNHDDNLRTAEKYKPRFRILLFYTPTKMGREVGLNQVAHTYTRKERKFFENDDLDFEELPPWIMPNDFYSTIHGKLQTFHLNTNTIAKDFLDYLALTHQGKTIDPKKNQIAWLIQEYKKAREAGNTVCFAQHHPFFCYGKRAYPWGWDGKIYLDNEHIKKLDLILQLPMDSELVRKILASDEAGLSDIEGLPSFSEHYCTYKMAKLNLNFLGSNIDYSWALKEMLFTKLGICPDVTECAHEHSLHKSDHIISLMNNGVLEKRVMTQLGSGGGGGELQARYYYGGSGEEPLTEKKEISPDTFDFGPEIRETDFSLDNLPNEAILLNKEEDSPETDSDEEQENPISQVRHPYGEQEKISVFSEKNGYFITECDPNNPEIIYIDLYYINVDHENKEHPDIKKKVHLRFTNLDSNPLRAVEIEEQAKIDKEAESLRLCILRAVKNYQAFIHIQQTENNGEFFGATGNMTHYLRDATISDNMQNYLNQYEPLEWAATLTYLQKDCAEKIKNIGSKNSLLRMINNEIGSFYGTNKTLEELYTQMVEEENKVSLRLS